MDNVDAAERALIRSGVSETLFVEAGAGTGKTFELVERLVCLIREGVPVSQIAAITFTEKAASELADRVRQRLEALADGEALAAEQERYRQAAHDLDQAAIQTLHSFAMRILSLYPLEAGLPPRLRLRDDVEARLAFREAWERFRDGLLDDPNHEETLFRALTIGLRLKDLQEVARQFSENWERIEAANLPAAAPPTIDLQPILDVFEEIAASRRPGVNDSLTRKLDALRPFLETLEGFQLILEGGGKAEERRTVEIDALRLLSRIDPFTKSTTGEGRLLGQKANWDDVQLMRDLVRQAETYRLELVGAARTACLCALLAPLRGFALAYAEERRKAGTLEFHDLLVLSRNLLRDNAAVRRALHQRFSRVLIDEFQDTDPLQVELAALIAMENEHDFAGWERAVTKPGSLFFVGDPKQSIYRFRRADIELYKRTRAAFDSKHVPLRQNFRCRPAIIEWVNQVCGEIFGGFGAGADPRQADWIPLEAGRDPGTGPGVSFIGEAMDGMRAPEIRMKEAEAIVAAIQAAKNSHWLKDDPTKRETRYSDIAILLPTRTNSPAIERALGEAGIPVRVESRSLLFTAQEIVDLTNILAAIDDPTDDVAVVASLRSPAFAVTDPELLEHVQAHGRWDYLRTVPEGSPQTVREAFETLGRFHEDRWRMSIGALVESVIRERKLLELGVTGPRPRESWRRLRFVAEQARSLGDSGTIRSLRQFVHWLRTQRKEGTRIAEAVANEPDDDAVRMLTIHAAKGLEFPIVILAGLGIGLPNFSDKVTWTRDADGSESVAVRAGVSGRYFDTPGFEEVKSFERGHQWLERDRLFYVGATRAKERLVVSLFHQPVKGGDHRERHAARRCPMAECLYALRQQHPEWHSLTLPMAMGNGLPGAVPTEETPEAREAWLRERARVIEASKEAPVIAATRLGHEDTGDGAEPEKPEPAAEAEPWRKGRAGTSLGRAVHAVLQTIDLATGEGIAETARAQAMAEGIANAVNRIERLTQNARASEAVRAAVASGRYWREVYVGCEVEGTVIEGFIDLLYESPEGLVVVDYKTDSAPNEAAIAEAMERYRLQGAAYALAVEQALGRPVARCVFVFTEPKAERAVPDLEAAKGEIEERLRGRAPRAGR